MRFYVSFYSLLIHALEICWKILVKGEVAGGQSQDFSHKAILKLILIFFSEKLKNEEIK